MIKIFYGDDRIKTDAAIKTVLGTDYELFEADSLSVGDMDSIFLGTSIFGEKRKILIKNLSEAKECWELLPKYTQTEHSVVIWEEKKPDARSTVAKAIAKDKNVELKEFANENKEDPYIAFNIFDTALRGDAKKALAMLAEIEENAAPQQFIGSMAYKAMDMLAPAKAYVRADIPRGAKAVKIVAKADMDIKSADVEPWLIVKKALIELANIK